MADGKISGLTERVTAVLGTDLLSIVGNTAGTPVNLKCQVKNFLANVAVDFPATSWSALKLVANVAINATSATLAAGELALIANASSGFTVRDRIGLLVRNEIQNGNSNVTGMMAAAVFRLDTANSNAAVANTFGLVVEHTLNTSVASARTVSPRAFLALKDAPGSGNSTLFLMDVGAQGNVVSANTSADANVVFSRTSDKTVNRTLKITVNGETLWLLASNVAPS